MTTYDLGGKVNLYVFDGGESYRLGYGIETSVKLPPEVGKLLLENKRNHDESFSHCAALANGKFVYHGKIGTFEEHWKSTKTYFDGKPLLVRAATPGEEAYWELKARQMVGS